MSLRDYGVVLVARPSSISMLLFQGGSDGQVSPEQDFARWQTALAGQKQVTVRSYDGLSHLFMATGGSGTPADYQAPAHVDAKVVQDIVHWVADRPAGS